MKIIRLLFELTSNGYLNFKCSYVLFAFTCLVSSLRGARVAINDHAIPAPMLEKGGKTLHAAFPRHFHGFPVPPCRGYQTTKLLYISRDENGV